MSTALWNAYGDRIMQARDFWQPRRTELASAARSHGGVANRVLHGCSRRGET